MSNGPHHLKVGVHIFVGVEPDESDSPESIRKAAETFRRVVDDGTLSPDLVCVENTDTGRVTWIHLSTGDTHEEALV